MSPLGSGLWQGREAEARSREELCMGSRMARPVRLERRSDEALRECLGPDHERSGERPTLEQPEVVRGERSVTKQG